MAALLSLPPLPPTEAASAPAPAASMPSMPAAAAAMPEVALPMAIAQCGDVKVYVSSYLQAMWDQHDGNSNSSSVSGAELFQPEHLEYLPQAWSYGITQKLGSGAEGAVYWLGRPLEVMISSSQGVAGAAATRVPVAVKVCPLGNEAFHHEGFLQTASNSMAIAAATQCAIPTLVAWVQPTEGLNNKVVLANLPPGCQYVGVSFMPQMDKSLEDLVKPLWVDVVANWRPLTKWAMRLHRLGQHVLLSGWHPRDFKSSNVLVSSKGELFVSDTG
jgi:hypothetical protein